MRNWPAWRKLKRHGAALREIPANLIECRTNILCGPCFIIGRALHDEGNATRPVAFISHFLKYHAWQFPGAFL